MIILASAIRWIQPPTVLCLALLALLTGVMFGCGGSSQDNHTFARHKGDATSDQSQVSMSQCLRNIPEGDSRRMDDKTSSPKGVECVGTMAADGTVTYTAQAQTRKYELSRGMGDSGIAIGLNVAVDTPADFTADESQAVLQVLNSQCSENIKAVWAKSSVDLQLSFLSSSASGASNADQALSLVATHAELASGRKCNHCWVPTCQCSRCFRAQVPVRRIPRLF